MPSFVWKYFTRDGKGAICKDEKCKKFFKSSGPSSLAYHLKSAHNITETGAGSSKRSCLQEVECGDKEMPGAGSQANSVQTTQTQNSPPKPKRQKTIFECYKYKSLEETVARLAAQDGLSIRQITRSDFIHQALAKDFPKRVIPRNQSDMISLIESFYNQTKEDVKQKIAKMKQADGKFSATLDEWTSLKNIRYINVNIHYSVAVNKTKYLNLGMIKIKGSCPADHMRSLFAERLADFGINVESDIITVTGDGASVMVAFGSQSTFEFIICLNHTIHIAVLAAVFPTKKKTKVLVGGDEDNEQDSSDEEDEPDGDEEYERFSLKESYNETISRMRAIIKFFKYSPVRNSILQELLKQHGRKPLQLLLDSKTRWNSLVISGKRFIDLLPQVLKALADIGSTLPWDDDNTELLQNLIDVLDSALIATEALSKDSINLIEGEVIIKTLVSETAKMNNQIAKEFHDILIEKLKARRNTLVTSLALYLFKQASLNKVTEPYPLELSAKKSVQQLGTNILKRLFEEETYENNNLDEDSGKSENEGESFQDVLKRALVNHWENPTQSEKSRTETITIQKDFRFYEQHQKKSPLLEKLFLALCSAQPTSTQSERNFSLAGTFVTKLRTRLSDKHVDILCFLKSHFLETVED